MAHGFSLTRHDGLDTYAVAFAAAGATVVVFDHRDMPVWVGLGEQDIAVSRNAIEKFASKAPRAELHRYEVGYFEPFYGDDPAIVAADQVVRLRQQIL